MENPNDNAAYKFNFVSELYQEGVAEAKKQILDMINTSDAIMHQEGDIHIHDLEGYGKIHNCCMPILEDWLRNSITNTGKDDTGVILQVFELTKSLIISLAMCQSGGIGFTNFDHEISNCLEEFSVDICPNNIQLVRRCMDGFLRWINTTYTRNCREPYYVTLNLGLDVSEWGRIITKELLDSHYESPNHFTRPNIVFKVKKNTNGHGAQNYDLFRMALRNTSKKMVPTYLLLDSKPNAELDPFRLAIMGCRTKIYQNFHGKTGSIGRGNIAVISINLPRIALKATDIDSFYKELDRMLELVKAALLRKANALRKGGEEYLGFIINNHLLDADSVQQMIDSGTLSIGFIGLSECVEVLSGEKPYENEDSRELSLQIMEFFRKKVDDFKRETELNFTILGTPAEMLSGRFCEIDKIRYSHKIQDKGFYTNSFHINVDSRVSIYRKIELEAPFHLICDGGCITYIELESVLLNNTLALQDIIDYSTDKGISYLGINFPYDVCNRCGEYGTFDICPKCGSSSIKRLRRVSGYLEDLSHFTQGKQAEESKRKSNCLTGNSHNNMGAL